MGTILATIASAASGWLLPLALASGQPPTTVFMPLGNEPDPYGAAVAKTVNAIAMYTRWPDNPAVLRACVVGPADHADDLLAGKYVAASGVRSVRSVASDVRPAACEIVYIGRLSLDQQRAVTDSVRGGAVLTIAENDPACRSRAMFCLMFQADSLSFRLNIDAVADSQIRVDPRVLRIGAGDMP